MLGLKVVPVVCAMIVDLWLLFLHLVGFLLVPRVLLISKVLLILKIVILLLILSDVGFLLWNPNLVHYSHETASVVQEIERIASVKDVGLDLLFLHQSVGASLIAKLLQKIICLVMPAKTVMAAALVISVLILLVNRSVL